MVILANWHPHLHLVVPDGGCRPDETFVRWPGWPSHDTLQLTEAFRRAVLRLVGRRGLVDEDQAQGMLQWPHSGLHVHTGVGVPEDDRAGALRLARSGARNPVALEVMQRDSGWYASRTRGRRRRQANDAAEAIRTASGIGSCFSRCSRSRSDSPSTNGMT